MDENGPYGGAFSAAMLDILLDVPGMDDVVAEGFRGGTPTLDLTPESAINLNTEIVWLLVRHVKALADEVDRLRADLDHQADGR